MDLGTTLVTALVMGVFGLAILILLWPSEKNARKLLGKWGVDDPSAEETAVAMRYLRQRRLWYPWLFLLAPFLPGMDERATWSTVVVTLLSGALLAELFAQRPARGPRREAVLEQRELRDFAPLWTLVVSAIVELASLVYPATHGSWVTFTIAAVAVAASWVVVALAVRRPADGSRRVDLALRNRSARIALGLGIGSVSTICWHTQSFPTFLAFVATVAAILAIASPPRKLPPIAARAG